MIGFFAAQPASAAPLSPDMEYITLQNVGTAWQTVTTANEYTAAVPVCSYVLASRFNRSAVVRIRNIQATSFELRIQEFTGGSNPTANTTPGTVFCTVADEGVHFLDDGRLIEARTVDAPNTAGQLLGWTAANSVDASPLFQGAFINPVAMTAVISANDPQPSVVWTYDCEGRGTPAFSDNYADGICVAKHIGQINATRATETIGIILAQGGAGVSQGINYIFFRGPRVINGVNSSPTFTAYLVNEDFEAATVTQTGEQGGQGGWATLVGTDPLPPSLVRVGIDEEVVAGDTSRSHVEESINVYAYRDERNVILNGDKTSAIWDPANDGLFNIPGNDVAYTLTVTNSGEGSTDRDSLFLVDELPPEIAFFNGDFDPNDSDTNPVRFIETGNSNLRFDYADDVGFSRSAFPPTSMAACGDAPSGPYDPTIRFICLNPKGAMLSGDPDPSISFEFRGRIE